ncbi:SEC14-like protein 3 [Saccoglossus kowalevskii]
MRLLKTSFEIENSFLADDPAELLTWGLLRRRPSRPVSHRKSLEYKKMMKLDELMLTWKDPEVMEKYFVGGLCGFDREGSPIWIDPFGYIDPKGIIYSTKSSDVIKSKLVLSETVQQLLHSQTVKTGHRVDTCIVIFDLDNVTITHIWKPFIDLYGKVLAMFEANYPETLKMCFITNGELA